MLELADIHTYYGESHVLRGVSLKVETGQVVALLGRNGMGKTTVARVLEARNVHARSSTGSREGRYLRRFCRT